MDFPARLARSMPGLNVVLDTSGAPLREAIANPIPWLAVLRMDDEEAEACAGRKLETRAQSADFAAELVQKGVAKQVIIARGADGSVMAEAGRRLFAKAAKVQLVSRVGAGDSLSLIHI